MKALCLVLGCAVLVLGVALVLAHHGGPAQDSAASVPLALGSTVPGVPPLGPARSASTPEEEAKGREAAARLRKAERVVRDLPKDAGWEQRLAAEEEVARAKDALNLIEVRKLCGPPSKEFVERLNARNDARARVRVLSARQREFERQAADAAVRPPTADEKARCDAAEKALAALRRSQEERKMALLAEATEAGRVLGAEMRQLDGEAAQGRRQASAWATELLDVAEHGPEERYRSKRAELEPKMHALALRQDVEIPALRKAIRDKVEGWEAKGRRVDEEMEAERAAATAEVKRANADVEATRAREAERLEAAAKALNPEIDAAVDERERLKP